MKSIKAIVAGILFVVSVTLLLQLAYIFMAVGYNALAAEYSFLHDIAGWIRYLLAIPAFLLTIFAGGYLTAVIAATQTQLKIGADGLLVDLIPADGMIVSTMDYSHLTLTGIIVTVLAILSSTAGGFYWLKRDKAEPAQVTD